MPVLMLSWADIHYNQPVRDTGCSSARPHEHLSKTVCFTVVSSQHIDFFALPPSSLVSFQLCKSMTRKCLLQGDSASADDNTYVGVMGVYRPLEKQFCVKVGVTSYFTVETMWHHPGYLQMHKSCSTSFQNPKIRTDVSNLAFLDSSISCCFTRCMHARTAKKMTSTWPA